MPADSAAGSAGSAAVVWKTGFSEELFSNCVRTQAGLLRKALELLRRAGSSCTPRVPSCRRRTSCSFSACWRRRRMGARPQGKKGARGRSRGLDAADAPTGPIRADIVPIDPARFPGMPLLPCTLGGRPVHPPERAVRRVLRLPSSPPVGAGRSSGRMAGALAESARWGHGQTCRSRAPAVLAASRASRERRLRARPDVPGGGAALSYFTYVLHAPPSLHRGRVQWTASPSEDAAWERGPSYVLQPGKP